MFIEKITICNLFAYFDEVKVEFERGKNLFLIYGNNGYGKTSFLRAIKLLFCGIDGEEIFGKKPKTDKAFFLGDSSISGILNKKAVSEGKREFFVEICGKFDNGENFSFCREFTKDQTSTLLVEIGNDKFEDDAAQEQIERLLPKDFVMFNLFDGEALGKVTEQISKSLKGQIGKALQISQLDTLIQSAEKVKDELRSANAKNKEEIDEINKLNYKKNSLIYNIKTNERSIFDSQAELLEIREEIDDRTRKKERLIVKGESERENLQREIESKKARQRALKDGLKNYRNVVLANSALVQSVKTQISQKNPRKSDVEAFCRLMPDIVKILRKERFGEGVVALVESLPQKLQDGEFAESFLNFANANALKEILVSFKFDFAALREISNIKNELKALQSEFDELEVDEVAKQKIEYIDKEIQDKRKQEKEREEIIAKKSSENGGLEEQLKDVEKKLLQKAKSTNDARIDKQIQILNEIIESVKRYKNELFVKIQSELQESLRKRYKSMFTDNVDSFQINDEFEIKAFDNNGVEVKISSQSSGQKQFLATALFWSLSEFSKKEKIPLVVDTPLGRIDTSNKRSLLQSYYKQENQIIVLPTDSEITRDLYYIVEDNVGGLYKIENNEFSRSEARIVKISKKDMIFDKV